MSARISDKEHEKLLKKIQALILRQRRTFTTYSVVTQILGNDPTVREYARVSGYVRNVITRLLFSGSVEFIKETDANVPGRKKRLYKVVPKPEPVSQPTSPPSPAPQEHS